MTSKYIRTLTIHFDTEISSSEIPLFRGAMLNAMSNQASLIFHNHKTEDTYSYQYPIIQYKRIGGHAAIVSIDKGADQVGELLSQLPPLITIGERESGIHVTRMQPSRILMQLWQNSFHYHISRWLPLNSENYQRYQSTESLAEKIQILEKILRGNLLSMLKGLDIHLEDELKVQITDLGQPYIRHNKGIPLMTFNADFKSNLSIPNAIGIGKNASIGYGVVHQIKEKQKKQDNNE